MNVLSTRVALRERTLAEVFDLAFRFVVVRGGRRYLRLWLVACLPCLLVCLALRRRQVEWEWVWAAALVGFVVAQIPFTLAASRLLLGDALPLANLLRGWLPKIPVQLLMYAVLGAVLAAGSLLVFPIPFILTRALYLPEITLLEGSGMFRAYQRGTRLTSQRMQHAIETMLLLGCVAVAFVLGSEVTGAALQVDLLGFPGPTDTLREGGSWFALFGFFAALPFLVTARFLTYIDERTRREAWDVQLRFTELAKGGKGGLA